MAIGLDQFATFQYKNTIDRDLTQAIDRILYLVMKRLKTYWGGVKSLEATGGFVEDFMGSVLPAWGGSFKFGKLSQCLGGVGLPTKTTGLGAFKSIGGRLLDEAELALPHILERS